MYYICHPAHKCMICNDLTKAYAYAVNFGGAAIVKYDDNLGWLIWTVTIKVERLAGWID